MESDDIHPERGKKMIKRHALSIALVSGLIAPSMVHAQNESLYLHCKGSSSNRASLNSAVEHHYRLNEQGLTRFFNDENKFYSPCYDGMSSFRCNTKVSDSDINHNMHHTFKSISGKMVFYETRIYISRYTGKYTTISLELDQNGNLIRITDEIYTGFCYREESPVISSKKF